MPPPRRIKLLDRTTTPPTPVEAEVVRDFPDAALGVVESLWTPERARLPAGVEHPHWNWARKNGSPLFEFVAVVVNAQVEGLAAVARSPVASRLVTGLSATYLHFIESAPWNLKEHPGGGRFRGVGGALLAEVVALSIDRGYSGRVLLNALPQAEAFYRNRGMTDLGPNSPGGLVYFEYTEAQATAFLVSQGVTV